MMQLDQPFGALLRQNALDDLQSTVQHAPRDIFERCAVP